MLPCKFWEQAEGEGFEPTMAFTIPVFKTGALNRSAIPPDLAHEFYHKTFSDNLQLD